MATRLVFYIDEKSRAFPNNWTVIPDGDSKFYLRTKRIVDLNHWGLTDEKDSYYYATVDFDKLLDIEGVNHGVGIFPIEGYLEKNIQVGVPPGDLRINRNALSDYLNNEPNQLLKFSHGITGYVVINRPFQDNFIILCGIDNLAVQTEYPYEIVRNRLNLQDLETKYNPDLYVPLENITVTGPGLVKDIAEYHFQFEMTKGEDPSWYDIAHVHASNGCLVSDEIIHLDDTLSGKFLIDVRHMLPGDTSNIRVGIDYLRYAKTITIRKI